MTGFYILMVGGIALVVVVGFTISRAAKGK
jgi:hypothetical protein